MRGLLGSWYYDGRTAENQSVIAAAGDGRCLAKQQWRVPF